MSTCMQVYKLLVNRSIKACGEKGLKVFNFSRFCCNWYTLYILVCMVHIKLSYKCYELYNKFPCRKSPICKNCEPRLQWATVKSLLIGHFFLKNWCVVNANGCLMQNASIGVYYITFSLHKAVTTCVWLRGFAVLVLQNEYPF